jgi:hypothetical protein
LYAKKRRLGGSTAETALLKALKKSFLANLSPCKPAVALNSHLAATQKISHGRYGFLGALCAGADSQNQVAQGKARTRFEDLFGLFHRG